VAQAILPVRFFGALVMGAHSQDWLCHVNIRRRKSRFLASLGMTSWGASLQEGHDESCPYKRNKIGEARRKSMAGS
jgi:hypothetical protein